MKKEWNCDSSVWALILLICCYIFVVVFIIVLLMDKAKAEERRLKIHDGVEIRIMNRSCAWDQNLLAGYMITPAGTLWGCWVFKSDMVWFYSQGNADVLRFPFVNFEIVTDGTEFKALPPKTMKRQQKEIEI